MFAFDLTTLSVPLLFSMLGIAGFLFAALYFWSVRSLISFSTIHASLLITLLVTPIFLFFSTNLVLFYVLLEIITFSFILLIALHKKTVSLVASIQYLIYNAVASSFFILGLILVYANAFSVDLLFLTSFFYDFFVSGDNQVVYSPLSLGFLSYFAINLGQSNLVVFGQFLILFSLCWKLAVFPLHFWLADIYEVIPLYLMAISSVILVFWYFLLFFYLIKHFAFLDKTYFFDVFFIVSTLGSVFFGAFGLIEQTNIRRFLAFSSIFNVGFVLLAAAILNFQALSYIFLYCLSNLVIFMFLLYLTSAYPFNLTYLSDLRFLRYNTTWVFLIIIVFLTFSGLPPLPGFFIKYSLLGAIYQHFNSSFLFIFAVVILNTLAAFAYLNVLKIILFDIKGPLANAGITRSNVENLNNPHFSFGHQSVVAEVSNSSLELANAPYSSIGNVNVLYIAFYLPVVLLFVLLLINPTLIYTVGFQLFLFV